MSQVGQSASMSRRTFLGGAVAGGAVLGAATTLNAVHAKADEASEAGASSTPSYRIINTDVLIIGGGNMGLFAARAALRDGRRVAIAEKGVFHHNGVTGMGWEFSNAPVLGTVPAIASQAIFGQAYMNAINYCKSYGDELDVVGDNLGQALPLRNEDGSATETHQQFLRHGMDELAGAQLSIIDRTLITDFIISGDTCYGAFGIDLATGGYVAIRANATLVASGPCTALYGWLGVHPQSIGTVEATGDPEAAAFRHGLGICGSEFCEFDMEMITPASIGATFGITINVDSREIAELYDKDRVPIFENPADERWSVRDNFTSEVARQLFLNGRATENGGLLANMSQESLDGGRPFNKRNAEYLAQEFGIDVTQELIEVGFEMYEKGGIIQIDDNMSTEIKGLFSGRLYRGGGFTNFNLYSGTYAGHCAALYAEEAAAQDGQESIDWSVVDAEIARLEDIRTREVADAIRPHVVRHAIQNAVFNSMGVCRNTAKMEETLAELLRIQEEDMPRMAPVDRSVVWNKEWKEAIENYNMLENAILTVKAALMREESRGYVIREDFPEQDDENWDCTLCARLVDGETVFEKIYPTKYDPSQIA